MPCAHKWFAGKLYTLHANGLKVMGNFIVVCTCGTSSPCTLVVAGLSPSTFTTGNGASASSEGAGSQFGGTVQSLTCTADPTLLNILKST